MQFLKVLFWCLLAFLAAVFTFGNWSTVPIRLWSGLVADVNLPLLLLTTFLAGLLPTTLYHQAIRWRLRHRLAAAERALDDLRAVPVAPVLPLTPVTPAPLGPSTATIDLDKPAASTAIVGVS